MPRWIEAIQAERAGRHTSMGLDLLAALGDGAAYEVYEVELGVG